MDVRAVVAHDAGTRSQSVVCREGKQTHKSQVGWGSTSARVRGEDDRPADRGLLFTPEDRPARAKKLRLEEPGVAPRKGAPHALHAEVEAVGSDEERLMASAKALIGRASEVQAVVWAEHVMQLVHCIQRGSAERLCCVALQVLSLMLLCKQHGAMQHLRSLDKTAGDALPGLTLRAAVTEDAGEKVVRALLHLLRPDEAGDALHGQLLTWCPSFFKVINNRAASLGPHAGVATSVGLPLQVEDRKALEAARHLSEAEALPEGPERTDRAQQAVRVLLELPASADLGSAVPKLIRLGMLDGAIQVVLK